MHGARLRHLAGAGAQDVLDDAEALRRRPAELGDRVARAELQHADARHPELVTRELDRSAAADDDLRARCFVEQAVHVTRTVRAMPRASSRVRE